MKKSMKSVPSLEKEFLSCYNKRKERDYYHVRRLHFVSTGKARMLCRSALDRCPLDI